MHACMLTCTLSVQYSILVLGCMPPGDASACVQLHICLQRVAAAVPWPRTAPVSCNATQCIACLRRRTNVSSFTRGCGRSTQGGGGAICVTLASRDVTRQYASEPERSLNIWHACFEFNQATTGGEATRLAHAHARMHA